MVKSVDWGHQKIARDKARGAVAFAFLCEPGTGKTKIVIDESVELYGNGKIQCLVVVGPMSAHINWEEVELPKWFPEYVNGKILAWHSGKTETKKWKKKYDEFMAHKDGMRVFLMNIDAVQTAKGEAMLKKVLMCVDSYLAIDESSRIKSTGAIRTKRMIKLGKLAKVRRIATGTPITQNPVDVYSQFTFLDESILGCSKYAFTAEYCDLLSHKQVKNITGRDRFQPQILARDKETGRPKFKNLDKLAALIAPYSYHVKKVDCLDLPPKVFERVFCVMTPEQKNIYHRLDEDLQIVLKDNRIATVSKLTSFMRLQQLLSGHLPDLPPIPTNRFDTLKELIEDIPEDESIIIWSRFTEDTERIAKMYEGNIVTYIGDTKKDERGANVAAFEAGEKRIFVGNQHAGGLSITLNRASHVIYFTNNFSLEDRIQSEDRSHRGGQTKSVTYYDIICRDAPIDRHILDTLESKSDVSIETLRHLERMQ
jgi:SNF2 family DNA or RNA helicase